MKNKLEIYNKMMKNLFRAMMKLMANYMECKSLPSTSTFLAKYPYD